MQRFMLKSKIHRATLTGTELDYEGSIAIDRDLLDAADMLPGDLVIVLSYCAVSDEEARAIKPIVVHVDQQNRLLDT